MVARWEHDDPRFVLGAMLPDFVQMCGARLGDVTDPVIEAGIACHHRTDGVFHDAPSFIALCRDARAQLRASGVGRATTLAAAHVGVELLLDGAWVEQPRVNAAYLDAMAHTAALPATTLGLATGEASRRFAVLCERLREAGSPRAYRDPAEVGHRLTRILARRPRLAPAPGDEDRLVRWAVDAQPLVARRAPVLREEVRDGLDAHGSATAHSPQ